VEEEIEEFEQGLSNNTAQKEEEFGDLLVSFGNYARFIELSPESALSKTNQKFINRFQLMEELIKKEQLNIDELSLEEMDLYWEVAKKRLKKQNTD